ncbi:VOC family protein [Leucobacter luti]|uniref:Glyoxylase I family protein n=1 Tax=Leucobacter luti TaxID=340320 RepID=A0A4R6S3Q0_9MICO|nr:VOC family protein [Leucobacter luti]MCW2289245.1 glyoxylase I family protein [Leucobacter luti]TCK39808.1 glyoxylase I family protein [Leucobacter luti]TDP93336.1 glyoxylase I family protein [Leucobacter luti]
MTTTLPGLRGTDHIGVTVPDIEQAHEFFTEILGCAYVYTLGPFLPNGSWMSEHLNIEDHSVMREIRFYRCGNGANFEVFEYDVADAATVPPKNSDVGGHHVALYVDDLDAAVEFLKDRGIRVLGAPTASSGPSFGKRWVYFLAPWGMQFELVSFPQGKAYEATADVLLWDTRE